MPKERSMGDLIKKKASGLDLFQLDGRIALVTGGARGLGRVFCETLAEFGADIAIGDINKEGALKTAEFLRNMGRKSFAVKADVSKPADVRHMVEETVEKLGAIDILINNAGITTKANKVADMPIEDWDLVLSIDLKGVFLCTRAVLPVMIKQGSGNIINISSVYGIRPLFQTIHSNPNVHYAAAKAGVISLTKETALEYAGEGIRVNAIAPGFYGGKLAQWRNTPGEEKRRRMFEEAIADTTPMGRRGIPTELKGLVLYLASDASSFVTGQVFSSDGGVCT
jgi:NAD(P)-dependent dehydrogenase (short-subunit alcohol dehydrogenase family)